VECLKKSEQEKRELIRVLTEEETSKIAEKRSADASAITCGSVITLSPTSIWVID
jgi:hypothetical protein